METNFGLYVAIAILAFIVAGLSFRLRNAGKRIDDLTRGNRNLNAGKMELTQRKEDAEFDLGVERAKLEKLGLLKFSAWLFEDAEFVEVMKAKVEELRPAALDRYNAKKEKEMATQVAEWEDSSRRSREAMEKREAEREEEAKRPKQSSGMIDASMGAVVTMSAMSVDTAVCDGGSSACM
jgi:hypothetical protein